MWYYVKKSYLFEPIDSPITLMVFTYDGMDDFDDSGLYRGNSFYKVLIDTK